ncbi:type II toxin-antitoxin system HicB family antitoxin [candidate division TA06 bacterium]|uniref:Type II toxin-antitoxin system HicB family antitoxin n=1 Tax=candidate division TA06 bacterium TaxID=2250710 RepID=A0A933MJF0_UNCT6|nr:type II toxin-antitoxin system HicB family antitoxin [candidate division TA06 bacterium]
MSYKVSVIIEKDENGFYAYAPELEGCQSQGDTLEEAVKNIKEAVELYLETSSRAGSGIMSIILSDGLTARQGGLYV